MALFALALIESKLINWCYGRYSQPEESGGSARRPEAPRNPITGPGCVVPGAKDGRESQTLPPQRRGGDFALFKWRFVPAYCMSVP